ncbi:MAG: restriction endonuclease subunit S [Sedimenticola sp.]
MSDWPEVTLTDVYEISSGLSKPADSFGSGYPFLSFKDVFGNYFIPDELSQLVESNEKERVKGSIQRGDVFLTRTSETMHELGMSSVALKDYPDATFNGFTKRLRPKEEAPYEVHPEFIGYYLRSPNFRRGMLAFSTMPTRASLNNDMIGRLAGELPPLEIQKIIARILKSLDDKIKLNRQANQTLEQIAQAIFKSWFVGFEPTRAKIAAKQNGQDPERAAMAAISGKSLEELVQLSPEQQQQLKTTAALFSDALVESELGEIPEGWNVEPLTSWGGIVCGKTPSKKKEAFYGGGIPFIKIPDMHENMYVVETADSLTVDGAETLKKKRLPKGSICVSCIATVGQVLITSEDSFTNQQINSIVPTKEYSLLICIFQC